jgi:hypothetical protein
MRAMDSTIEQPSSPWDTQEVARVAVGREAIECSHVGGFGVWDARPCTRPVPQHAVPPTAHCLLLPLLRSPPIHNTVLGGALAPGRCSGGRCEPSDSPTDVLGLTRVRAAELMNVRRPTGCSRGSLPCGAEAEAAKAAEGTCQSNPT